MNKGPLQGQGNRCPGLVEEVYLPYQKPRTCLTLTWLEGSKSAGTRSVTVHSAALTPGLDTDTHHTSNALNRLFLILIVLNWLLPLHSSSKCSGICRHSILCAILLFYFGIRNWRYSELSSHLQSSLFPFRISLPGVYITQYEEPLNLLFAFWLPSLKSNPNPHPNPWRIYVKHICGSKLLQKM